MTVDGIKALNTDGTWSGNEYTINGAKFTILTDSANNVIGFSTDGTTSANHVMLKLGQLTLKGGLGYTLTGCPSNGSFDGYRLSNFGSNTVDVNDYGSGGTITVSNDESYTFMIYVKNSGTVLSGKTFYPMLRLSTVTDSTFAPYTNICPISGRTGTTVSTRNEDNTETASATISFGTTVYGGQVDFKTGIVTVEWGYIASYNGETLPSEWISDRDVYASGTTPTTGAEVAYKLATPTELTLTPAELQMLKGYNYITGDGVITITAYAINEEVGA